MWKPSLGMPASRLALVTALGWAAFASPAFAYGQLELARVPAGARLLVDGAPGGNGQGQLLLAAGAHKVQVVGAGAPRAYTVRISDGKVTRLSVEPPHVAKALRRQPVHRMVARPQAASHHAVMAAKPAVEAQPALKPEPVAEKPVIQKAVKEQPQAVAIAPQPLGNADGLPLPAPAFAPPVGGGGGGELAEAPAASQERPPSTPQPWWPDDRTTQDLGAGVALSLLALGLAAWFTRRRTQPTTWQARRASRGPVAPTGHERASGEAWAALQAGDWDVASRALWTSLSSGGSAWLYYHLGVALERLGRGGEAEQAYRAALFAEPGHELAAFNLAALLDRQGQQGQAALAYRKLLEAHPDHADALVNLGQLYRELAMPQQAEVHWRAARQLAPRDRALAQDLRRLRGSRWG